MNSMFENSTLFAAILVVGALAYMGTIAFDPTHPVPRIIAGYVCGSALVLIGAGSFFFGAAFELPLAFSGVYFFEALHMEWLGLGVVAMVVGMVIMRQAFRRQ